MKKISIEKDKDQFAYDFHEYEYQKEYRRMEIEWKEEYSVGVKEIDDQHKYFISLLIFFVHPCL